MRVAFVSSYNYWGQLDPENLWGTGGLQIGGGETAMLNSAREWAKAANEVWVFCNCKPGHAHGIDFVPERLYPEMVTSLDLDAIIAWDYPAAFRYGDRARVHILAFQLNHAQVGVYSHVIDRYWHPSEWHAKRFNALWPEIDTRKQAACMTNGVDLLRYTRAVSRVLRDRTKVVYTSSPDRGLHHLLRFWPQVVDAIPDATLDVYYDIERWLAMDQHIKDAGLINPTGERADLIRAAFNDPPVGVTFKGGVGQAELARAQLGATVLCYPCDPVAPTEGFSMTVLEGLTAGCQVIISDADAFSELWGGMQGCTMLPLPVHDDTWVQTIVMAIQGREGKPPDRIREVLEHQWHAVYKRQFQEVRNVTTGKS